MVFLTKLSRNHFSVKCGQWSLVEETYSHIVWVVRGAMSFHIIMHNLFGISWNFTNNLFFFFVNIFYVIKYTFPKVQSNTLHALNPVSYNCRHKFCIGGENNANTVHFSTITLKKNEKRSKSVLRYNISDWKCKKSNTFWGHFFFFKCAIS